MLARLALIACTFCLAQTAIAATPAPASDNLCRQQLPTIRALWQHDAYDAPPAVAALMVDAIDGKLPQLRAGLATLPAAEQARWRQVAMLTAANAYQPAVVDGLLDDGAAANEPAQLPPLKRNFEHQLKHAMAQDPRFGPRVVEGLQAAGLMRNVGSLDGPAVLVAAECDDPATLDVLLRHHADVMARAAPRSGDALMTAVIDGHAGIVQRLLDHGADACADDRRIHKPGATLASVGRRHHLPEALVQRLDCPAGP